jgi:hypothetical protein
VGLPPISARDIMAALYGATRLAQGDRSGIQFFGDTVEAFWKSFWAAAILAPAYALLVIIHLSDAPVTSSLVRVTVVELVAYVALWAAFPLAMHYVTEAIDREEHYIRYIVANNWASVLQLMLQLFVASFLALDLLPHGVADALSLATYAAILVYQWFVARVGLELGSVGAAGIVLLDFVISLILNAVVGAML